ncbi:hypothetical protein [Changchengzhania lutea]|uniref:hypothetical protein n=1 Tax=Changchengzhania lutea TaxID=2049305 RepID=UPI00163D4A6F|nr:hypothetical protein [Changchengzhania lutea]
MNYLTPEIAALEKNTNTNSLVRPTISCGIFQDSCYNESSRNNIAKQKALGSYLGLKK